MTYRNIDRKRYEYLLQVGVEVSEISQFFKNCQRQLILHGAKVQNLPTNHKSAIRTECVNDLKLRKEQKDWRERVRKQNEEFRKLPDNVSKAVKAAFDKVRSDGLSTIGELAVFKALFEVVPNTSTNSGALNENLVISPQPIMRDLMIDCEDDVSTLKKFGISSRSAKAFSLVGDVARKTGLIICVRGIAACPIVEGGWAGLTRVGFFIPRSPQRN